MGSRKNCLYVLREVLKVLEELEFEYDPDKRDTIRAALRTLIERHMAEVEAGREL